MSTMLPVVRMGPRESRGWLLGLRLPQVVLVVAAAAALIGLINGVGPLFAVAGGMEGVSRSVMQFLAAMGWVAVIAAALSIAFLSWRGRYLDEFVPVVAGFALQRVTGHHTYRGGIFRMAKTDPTPTLTLPGDLATLEFLSFDTGTGEQIAVVKDPVDRTYTAVLLCQGTTFALADSSDKTARVLAFGALQARLTSDTNLLSRIQILERTEPDSGEGLHRDWIRRGQHDGGWVAQSYEELLDASSGVQQAHETYVAVSLDAARASGDIRRAGGGDRGASAVLFRELDAIATALRECGVRVEGWCPPRLLGYVLRTAYDPASRHTIDRRGGADNDLGGGDGGLPSGVDLRAAGPMRAENEWGRYRTDSAVHRTWWVTEWPRREVEAGFMMPLLLSTTCRRSISWVFEPVPTIEAKRAINRKISNLNAERGLRARLQRRTRRHEEVEEMDQHRREDEIVAGHGMCRMLGFISTTAVVDPGTGQDENEMLDRQSGEIERLAARSSIEISRLWGEHDQGFGAAALPLCRGMR